MARAQRSRYASTNCLAAEPNPANPTTTLRYGITEAGDVLLRVYSIAGQLVRTLVDVR